MFVMEVSLGYFNYKYRVVFVIRDGELAVPSIVWRLHEHFNRTESKGEYSSFVLHVDAVTFNNKHVLHNGLTEYPLQCTVPSRLNPSGRLTRNLTLYAPCIVLQYVYKPTRGTKFL